MKKLILIAFVLWNVFIFTGCSQSGNGELVGVQNRPKWRESQPYGWYMSEREVLILGQVIRIQVCWHSNQNSFARSILDG